MEAIKEKGRAKRGQETVHRIRLQKPVLNRQQNSTGWGSVSISILRFSLIIKKKQAAAQKKKKEKKKEVEPKKLQNQIFK